MSLLLDAAALASRGELARGSLASLADSLAADLAGAMALPLVRPPKARLTRRGGRCPRDGVLLAFDPSRPHEHRCPRCGEAWRGDDHDGWWAMGYQLWLAERVVHAATLHALRGEPAYGRWARDVLEALAESYLGYANRDNVLGPSRPFFSTYLESLWLLHVCIAVDLLELVGAGETVGGVVRERLVEPSAALIASFDEGNSNRQVWNAAALVAAYRLLDREAEATRVADGAHGVLHHLAHGLLADGTWYEGENYHQFAQRGLWYGVALLEAMGGTVPVALEPRWRAAAVAPFLTALPDFTLPARRDSQWRTSLRQWRFAEMAELGLARDPGERRLAQALVRLYEPGVPRGDTGRANATGEAERNSPPVGLTRADLGWRSLLFALPNPPLQEAAPLGSVLLPAQGYAILRRDRDELYAALDYGQGGGGHGHPDRLNLVLQHGDARWEDDPGTGSYTDPTLHWYRSTLAHHAPLVNGRTQCQARGRLLAFEDRGAVGWVDAEVDGIAPGVRLRRTLVAMPDYLLDELSWEGTGASFVDLPLHLEAEVNGASGWTPGDPAPEFEPDAGFAFIERGEHAPARPGMQRLVARSGERSLDGWIHANTPAEWWRATAPGAPGEERQPLLLLRAHGARGRIVSVWSWAGSVVDAGIAESAVVRARVASGGPPDDRLDPLTSNGARVVVQLRDGSRHEHWRVRDGWHVAFQVGRARSSVTLSGADAASESPSDMPPDVAFVPEPPSLVLPRLPDDAWHGPGVPLSTAALAIELGEAHWRGSEQSWQEAGAPTARVRLAVLGDRLAMEVDVRKQEGLAFAPERDENPLDNEHPDTNSDGVQLHLARPDGPAGESYVWLLVPAGDDGTVRITPRTPAAASLPLLARWWPTRTGWAVRADVSLAGIASGDPPRFAMDVLVNEMPPDRERRRGQLVLSGARGERVWLRGDRHDRDRYLPMTVHA